MSQSKARPRRQNKGDRLLSGARAAEVQADYSVAPFDRQAVEMDAKWGTDQLPSLVSSELAAKYGYAIGRLNEFLRARPIEPDRVQTWADACVRGMRLMDAEAESNGAPKASAEVFFEFELTGNDEQPFRCAVIHDGSNWRAIKAARPDLVLFTAREVAVCLQAQMKSDLVRAAKDQFPQAEIVEIKKQKRQRIADDAIPF